MRKETARSPRTGLPHDFFVLDAADWVNVIAVTDDRRVVLVHQYRHGTEEVTLEIPGGSLERSDRSALSGARRELLEETGYVARRWKRLGVVHPNPAIQSNACTTYLAQGLRRAARPKPDAGEDLAVELVPLEELSALVANGTIRHSLVVAAFYFLDLASRFRRRGQARRSIRPSSSVPSNGGPSDA